MRQDAVGETVPYHQTVGLPDGHGWDALHCWALLEIFPELGQAGRWRFAKSESLGLEQPCTAAGTRPSGSLPNSKQIPVPGRYSSRAAALRGQEWRPSISKFVNVVSSSLVRNIKGTFDTTSTKAIAVMIA